MSDFRQRSLKKLEHLGDTAVDGQRYDEAISLYSTALSLDPPSSQGVLIKRSKALVATGSWKQAIDDANQVHNFCLAEVNLTDP
jgi:tetratricopeptide (TPR) repeat protein